MGMSETPPEKVALLRMMPVSMKIGAPSEPTRPPATLTLDPGMKLHFPQGACLCVDVTGLQIHGIVQVLDFNNSIMYQFVGPDKNQEKSNGDASDQSSTSTG